MAQYTCSYLENTELTKKKYVERINSFHSEYTSIKVY